MAEHAGGYTTTEEARAQALAQHAVYAASPGVFRIVRTAGDVSDAKMSDQSNQVGIVILLEGADAIRSVGEVGEWHERGLRLVGLAWKRTRYAGGTGAPGPLTEDGVALVRELDRYGIIHDASHLAEESFWQLLKMSDGPVMASHSNCQAIVPTDRQLSDDMIRAVVERGGVVGINFYDKFLLGPDEYKKRPATLGDVVRHVRHVCDLAGNTEHVAIGTDMDGGFGRGQIPEEIGTSAELWRVGEAMERAGFSPPDVENVLHRNWLRFFRRHLPRG